jgi:hypothetical protein
MSHTELVTALALVILLVLVLRFAVPARFRLSKSQPKWWWPLVGVWTPYGHRLPNRMRVRSGMETLADSDRDVALVSRHSLLGSGIICPVCHHQAALPGEFDKIVQSPLGEGVFCICHRMLVASPDDDVDPVDPLKPYDEKVYHTFVRPPNTPKPRPRTLKRPPIVNDRVFIAKYDAFISQGKAMPIRNGEGTVMLVHDDVATVSVIRGISSNAVFDIPLSALEVMDLPIILLNDRVEVNRGPRQGAKGTIEAIKDGTITVRFIEGTTDYPIEHLTKITE